MTTVCIVDPLGSGKPYIQECKNKGLSIIQLYTVRKKLLQELNPKEKNYPTLYLKQDRSNLNEIIETLKSHNISGIIPAWETSIEIADIIAEKLNLVGNSTKTSLNRRDKYEMRKAFKAAELLPKHFKFAQCRSFSELETFLQEQSFPVVIKTPRGAGNNMVFVCHTLSEAKSALNTILMKKNIFKEKTNYAVIETFISGIEYFVNLISDKNGVYPTDIWAYTKTLNSKGKVLYNNILQITDKKIVDRLSKFAVKCVKAVDINYGAAHCEMMWDHDTDSILPIEIAGRLAGCKVPEFICENSNVNIYQQLIDIYLTGTIKEKFSIEFTNRLAVAMCHNYRDGIVDHITGLERIQGLSSYRSHGLHGIAVNQYLPETQDMLTVPLIVRLANNDATALLNDLRQTHQNFKIFFQEESISSNENKINSSPANGINLKDVAIGSAILGSGGGGPVKLGFDIANTITSTIKEAGLDNVKVINIDELNDDDLIVCYAAMGSEDMGDTETVVPENPKFIDFIKKDLVSNIVGIMPLETGAVNSLLPFKIASSMQLPIVDVDMCGRAVPTLDLTGISLCSESDQKFQFYCLTRDDDYISIYTTPKKAERFFRSICADTGIISTFMYPASVGLIKKVCNRNSLTISAKIGHWARENIKSASDIGSLLDYIKEFSPYHEAEIIAQGEIIENKKINKNGFMYSKILLADTFNSNIIELRAMNEFYELLINNKKLAAFPDIISVFNNLTHMPITSDECKINHSITVVKISAPKLYIENSDKSHAVMKQLLGRDTTAQLSI